MTDAADPTAGGVLRSRPAIGWSALPAPSATQASTASTVTTAWRRSSSSTTAIASDPVASIDCATIANARLRAAALERLPADDVVQEHLLGIARVLRPLIVRGHRVVRLHELARVRILQHQLLEVRRRKGVDHHVARRPRRVQAARRAGEALDPQHVARAAHIPQDGTPVRLVPERHGPLLNHEHVKLVRFPLPQDVFVRLVKPHAPARGELEEVAVLHGLKGRMLLEEIGDAVADGGSVHRRFLAVES